MVATPTFVAPLGDLRTGDRIQSRQGLQISSSPGPLWMLLRDLNVPFPEGWYIASLVPDNMGLIARRQRIDFLETGPASGQHENPTGLGGDAHAIWMCTVRRDATGQLYGRLYELDPITFVVRRSVAAPSGQPSGIDGETGLDDENTVIWLGTRSASSSEVWKLNGALQVIRSKTLYPPLPRIGGDRHRYWGVSSITDRIYEFTDSQTLVREDPGPFADEGHRPQAIGGSSRRLYCTTFVENARPHWERGRYTHTLDPNTIENGSYRVLRTYGPYDDRWGSIALGGM